jgi:pimeloyl-ACP methyl ester carboxylesterase
MRFVEAGALRVGLLEFGDAAGWPAVLLHGFPYDAHAYEEVAPRLAEAGARVVVPWLRGYGPTAFLSEATSRSGAQGALAADLLALLDALGIRRAVLGGYDWGGRAACIAAALWPERVAGLVTVNGYNMHHVPSFAEPAAPEAELRWWYQYYFHGERGRAGLARNRHAFCRLLWRLWSPGWSFDEACFTRSAAAFDNPDFVDVVIHSYRHRFGLAPGDPAHDRIESRLLEQPAIAVPSVVLEGGDDGVDPPQGAAARRKGFAGAFEHRIVPGAGHNLPQEAPAIFAEAVLRVRGMG